VPERDGSLRAEALGKRSERTLPFGGLEANPTVRRTEASLLACSLDKTGSEARLRDEDLSQPRSFQHPDRRRGDTSFGGRRNVGVWTKPAFERSGLGRLSSAIDGPLSGDRGRNSMLQKRPVSGDQNDSASVEAYE
jgi:hypothetical protein